MLRASDRTPLVTLGRFIGRATNNVAEYKALVTALQEAQKLGAKKLLIRGDSELVVRQMTGVYKVKHPDMIPLNEQAHALLSRSDRHNFEHTLRHKKELGYKLSYVAIDRRADLTEADEAPIDAPAPRATSSGDEFACPRCGCVIKVRKPSSIRPHQLKPFACQCGNRMSAVE